MANYGNGAWSSDRDADSGSGSSGPQHRTVLRLGTRCALDIFPSLPERYRARETQSHGKLGQILLLVATNEIWCRLDSEVSGQVWPPGIVRTDARIVPLRAEQSPTPPPEAIALYPHMLIEGREGFVGKLQGIVVATSSGLAGSLLVHVRKDLDGGISGPSDPLRLLLPVEGQEIMVAADWAKISETNHHLRLDATIAQIAHGLVLRPDREIQQDIWNILGESRALAPYIGQFQVDVQDGAVTITGQSISGRLRSSLEQDIWHVSGVLSVQGNFG